ncbi:hypothetical protein ERYG_05091 [Escherichia coli M114]|nr:hypothetical protein ERYG_05091 [Escherichia coli M114]
MSIKHYDVVRAASPSDLAEKLTQKLKEGWQPFGGPVAITPYTLMQAVTAEGDVEDDVSGPSGGEGAGSGGADTCDTATETVLFYRAADGWPADLGWTRTNGAAEFTDDTGAESGKALRISKDSDAGVSWTLTKEMPSPADLLTRGGVVSCRFKLEGDLVANQYAFALYLRVPAASLPEGVTLAESGGANSNPCLLAFFIRTDATRTNLYFRKQNDVSVGTYGAFDNEWHTLELQFAGNSSIDVTPVLDGTAGMPFTLTKSAVNVPENTFTVTDTASAATYSTLFEYVTVEVNAA